MFEPLERTLQLIGDDVITACLAGRDSAREGLSEYKKSSIGRFRSLRRGTVYGILHDFYFDGVSRALEGNSRTQVIRNKAGDHVIIDDQMVVMFKKHSSDHRVSSYPTKNAKRYHSGAVTLNGLQLTTFTAGYVYDDDLNEVGAAVISHRLGLSKTPHWCVEIERPTASQHGAGYVFNAVLEPDIPLIQVEPKEQETEGTGDL